MARWGGKVLDWLDLRGDERVLDAGCGSGRVTEQLLERLPRGRAVALDASPAMVDQARASAWRASASASNTSSRTWRAGIPIDGLVDAVLSTATLHWIPDHDAVFRNFGRVLRPGGWLVAQAGGRRATCAACSRPSRQSARTTAPRYTSPIPEPRGARLEAAGFTDIETWLQPEPTALPRTAN